MAFRCLWLNLWPWLYFVWCFLLLSASLLSSAADFAAIPSGFTPKWLPKHQKQQRERNSAATEGSPDHVLHLPSPLHSMSCSLPQKGSILISHKKGAVRIIVTIFSFHSLSDIEKEIIKEGGERWLFTRKEKEAPFNFCLGVLLNTRLFTRSCLQKNICLI